MNYNNIACQIYRRPASKEQGQSKRNIKNGKIINNEIHFKIGHFKIHRYLTLYFPIITETSSSDVVLVCTWVCL